MIALASDHAGYPLKEVIKAYLESNKIPYKDFGTHNLDSVHYPEYGKIAAEAVANNVCEKGIIFCGTGVGISIAANKVKGIRCVNCSEPYSAEMARVHNNANMLSIGSRVVGDDLALMIVKTFLSAKYEGGRHQVRVDQLIALDEER